jgi:NAD(P)-dependent dehydrogenase (short-subunit alcohol dehydrogenase family)
MEVVVITGASAGVGRAVAERFARKGAKIGILARGQERLEATAEAIRAHGGEALALPADVADAHAVDAAASLVEQRLGPIDIWINCAMATVFAPVSDITPEEFRRATEVTYLGCVHGTMAALHRMRTRKRGVIVQVGSALAYRAIPLQAPYCGAKFAIRGFTDSLRSELRHDRLDIHLTMVQLPAVNTPQFDWARNKMPRAPQPVPPIFEPEVAAEAIYFAGHARRREVFVAGSTWKAVLANRVAPGLLDRYLARAGYRDQLDMSVHAKTAGDNLFAPAPGTQGAHGRFDDRAKDHSAQLWAAKRPAVTGAAGLGMMALLALLGIAAIQHKPAPKRTLKLPRWSWR